MNRTEQLGIALAVAEVAGPLVLGLIHAVIGRKYVAPKVMPMLGGFTQVLHSPFNVFLSYVAVGLWLGLAVACHSWNAAETLAWLRAHPFLPVEPTPTLLRVVYFGATFFTGSALASLPSSSDELASLGRERDS